MRSVVFVFLVLCVLLYVGVYANPLIGQINKTGINVRVDSTVFSKSIGVLKEGEKVKIIKEKFNWYKVILPCRFVCYASSAYLDREDRNVKVKASSLNLRLKPSLDSVIIGKAKKGEILTLLKEQNGWARVEGCPYIYGWVCKKFVDVAPRKTKNTLAEKNSKKSETIAVKKKKHNLVKRKDRYDYFTVEGTIYKLEQIKNCSANYKLSNRFAMFFIKVPNIYNASKLLEKKVIIKGRRVDGECPYIYVEGISPL